MSFYYVIWSHAIMQVMDQIHSQCQASTSEVAAVPLHGLSAKTGDGVHELLPAAMQLYDTWNKRLTTSRLNAWLEKVKGQLPLELTTGCPANDVACTAIASGLNIWTRESQHPD